MKRDHKAIRIWLIKHDLRQSDVARAMGTTSAKVCDTVHGRRNDRRILAHLLKIGVPAEALGLITN